MGLASVVPAGTALLWGVQVLILGSVYSFVAVCVSRDEETNINRGHLELGKHQYF